MTTFRKEPTISPSKKLEASSSIALHALPGTRPAFEKEFSR
jgi:hypothetical protein